MPEEPTLAVSLRFPRNIALRRGGDDALRNCTLMPNGQVVLDFEGFDGTDRFLGTVVGEWRIEE